MAGRTFDAAREARERQQSLIDDLRAAFDPRIAVDPLLRSIEKFAKGVAAQADLAENIMIGLRRQRQVGEISQQLEAGLNRAERLGVSRQDLTALVRALDLDPPERRTLELAVNALNSRRQQALQRQQLETQRQLELRRRLETEARRNVGPSGPELGR